MSQGIRFVMAVAVAVAVQSRVEVEAATLRGTVVAADGSPAAGAEVWAVNHLAYGVERREAVADAGGRYAIEVGPGLWATEARLGDQGMADAQQTATVDTADPAPVTIPLKPQGRLRAKLVEAETGRPVVGGRLVLDNGLDPSTDVAGRVEVGGLSRRSYHEAFVVAPRRERFRVLFEMAEGPTTDLEVAVPRGAKVVGRVLDRAGLPVAGASVSLSASARVAAMSALWTRADDQGRFECDGFPVDRAGIFYAVADGFADGLLEGLRAPLDGSPLEVNFRLAPADPGQAAPGVGPTREVVGIVVDPEGKPAAARLRWGFDLLARSAEARTDAAGRFRLAPVPDAGGSIGVLPERLDLAAATVEVLKAEREVRVVLQPGHTATGVLRDAEGTTYPGVAMIPSVLGVGRRGWSLLDRRTLTDDRGRFLVAGLPGKDVAASFLGEGMVAIRSRPLELDRENVVTVEPTGAILGRVVDGAGRPVRNFRVLVRALRELPPADKPGSNFAGFVGAGLSCTAEDGRFLVRNLTAGAAYRVTILAPGFGAEPVDRVVALPRGRWIAESTVLIHLGPPNVLEVRVREPDSGRPVPNARVAIVFGETSKDSTAWSANEISWDDSVHARTGGDGVARFDPLAFDEGTILVQAPGYARQNFGWRDHSANLDAWLQPEASIEGTVIDAATGLPAEGAVAVVTSNWLGRVVVPLDPVTGRFQVGELAAGRYKFAVSTGGRNPIHTEEIALKVGERATRALRLKVPER